MLTVKIKYAPGVKPIRQAHPGEWYDLRASMQVAYDPGSIVIVPLGVAMELPPGYEAIIRPRSSMTRKCGLVFADSGVIDNSFRGDNDWWGSTWYAVRSGVIRKNQRIAQFRIQRIQERAEIIEVEELGNSDRGGYGSTGEE